MEDSRIIEMFFDRNENAIKATADKYGGRLSRISYNIVNDGGTAEECVNDTYLAVWNNIPPQKPACFPAYLYAIVRNISYDAVDKRTALKRNAVTCSLDGELSEILHDSNSSDINDKELARALNLFLGRLGQSSRVIFIKRYYFGETVADISDDVGSNAHAVSVKLFKIRTKLKNYLKREGFQV